MSTPSDRATSQALAKAKADARTWHERCVEAERRAVHLAMRVKVLETALLVAKLPLPTEFGDVH